MRYIVESNLSWKEIHALIHGADKGENVTVLKTKHALFFVKKPDQDVALFYGAEHGEDGLNHMHEMPEIDQVDFSMALKNRCPVCKHPLIPQEQYDACHCGECGFTWDQNSMYFTSVIKTIK